MLEAGADAIKLFPAEASGPAVLRAMRAVLPAGTMVLPVGGIEPGNMRPWLEAGAAGFGARRQIRWAGRRCSGEQPSGLRSVPRLRRPRSRRFHR